MDNLPNHIKVKVLQYIPRRVHPVATIMKNAFEKYGSDLYHWGEIDYCECCGEHCNDAGFCWICDYKHRGYNMYNGYGKNM
jgi:hypothetical protein